MLGYYINPNQLAWIEDSYGDGCHLGLILELFMRLLLFSSLLLCLFQLMIIFFNVSLFWFVAKHKGRFHCVNATIVYVHWLHDYT